MSFAFYLPVVLAGHIIEELGMLMIPKTCAYVWAVVLGYVEMSRELKSNVSTSPSVQEQRDETAIWQGNKPAGSEEQALQEQPGS